MKLHPHDANDFTGALQSLLPPGAAWEWPIGGMGHAMLAGTAEELARVESAVPGLLEHATDSHRPRFASWHLSEYQRIARDALAGITETRKTCAVGARIGDRLWSASVTDFAVPLVEVYHLFAPMRVGRHVGDGLGRDPAARLWRADRTRYILLVRYYRSVVDPQILWDALADFAQAHVLLWFEDITGIGGSYAPH